MLPDHRAFSPSDSATIPYSSYSLRPLTRLPPTRDVSSSARSSALNSYAFSLCAPAYFAFLLGTFGNSEALDLGLCRPGGLLFQLGGLNGGH